ncbi:MAG: S24 family peptidase [Candidatus Gracilibacteria bacterium]|jgi:SOS regulatory protein LexA
MNLTSKQTRFLELLESFITENHQPPTLEEMKAWLEKNDWGEIRSLNSVKQYFDSLESAGRIRRERKKRGLELLENSPIENVDFVHIPVMESPVACGNPNQLIEETPTGSINVSRKLVSNPKLTYAFHASGDSMNLAGIEDGDTVLVEATTDVKDGDIVLASVDGCGTLKILRKSLTTITLLPKSDNPTHQPIYLHPEDEFLIGGRVVNILKN